MKVFQLAKLLFALVLLAAALPSARAQMTDDRTRFGLKAGVSAANFTQSDFDNRKGRVGFVGGIFAKIPLGERNMAAFRPELLFTMKGATVAPDSLPDVSFKLNYLELPLSFDLNLLAIFNVHGGLQAGTLISSVNRDWDVNKLDAGWHLGAGLDLGNLGLHARYNASFTNLFDNLDGNEVKNWNLTVTASVSLN